MSAISGELCVHKSYSNTRKLTDDVDSGDSEEICVMLHYQGCVILDMAL